MASVCQILRRTSFADNGFFSVARVSLDDSAIQNRAGHEVELKRLELFCRDGGFQNIASIRVIILFCASIVKELHVARVGPTNHRGR
jgi:hypothetical protein